jgi:four helix bundle protein
MGKKGNNLVLEKAFRFAVRIVKLTQHLQDKKEFILSKQLLRSGTSIGANVNEAQAGQSKKDFIAKMCIASKEARETKYWLDLLVETSYLEINDIHVKSLLDESLELVKLFTSIIKSSQENNNSK